MRVDEGTNVSDAYEQGNNRFSGRIHTVTVDVKEPMRSERRAAEGDGRAAHMRRYRLELMLGTVSLAVFLAFYRKVSPGPKLTREEVAADVPKIE